MISGRKILNSIIDPKKCTHTTKKHHIGLLWEGGGQFMKMVLLTNIVTTTGIEKQNAHKHTIKISALIRDGGARVMKMVPISNIATST